VLELLLAASLSALLVGLAIQGTFEYFRLKQGLLIRTELRHAVEAAKTLIGARLRQAIAVVPLSEQRYVLVLARDLDRCGYLCEKDRYELLRWEVVPDVGQSRHSYLREVRVVVPAFRLPATEAELAPLFSRAVGGGTRLASGVKELRLEPGAGRLYRTSIVMQRDGGGRTPVTLAHQEFVAIRTNPRAESLATLAAEAGATPGPGEDAP
jgi:hypothetical protein